MAGQSFPKIYIFFSLSRCNGEAPHRQGKSDATSEVLKDPTKDLDAESILPKAAR